MTLSDTPPFQLEGQAKPQPLPPSPNPLLIGTPYVCDLLVYTGGGTYTAEPVIAWFLSTAGLFRPVGIASMELPDDTGRWALRHQSDPHKVYDVVKLLVFATVPDWLANCGP